MDGNGTNDVAEVLTASRRLWEWWQRTETGLAHVVTGMEYVGSAPVYLSACGRNMDDTVRWGRRSDDIEVSCSRFQDAGACRPCIRAVFDRHSDRHGGSQPCVITAAKRLYGVPEIVGPMAGASDDAGEITDPLVTDRLKMQHDRVVRYQLRFEAAEAAYKEAMALVKVAQATNAEAIRTMEGLEKALEVATDALEAIAGDGAVYSLRTDVADALARLQAMADERRAAKEARP